MSRSSMPAFPDGSGLSLLGKLDQASTLIITANPECADGMLRFPENLLAKPLDLEELGRRVGEVMRRRSAGAGGDVDERLPAIAGPPTDPGDRRERQDAGPATRVALYGHDTMGLGHARRNLRLARALAEGELGAEVLVIGGARESGVFEMPAGADSLILPAISKDTDGRYHSRSLRVPLERVSSVRRELLRSGLVAFEPDVLIVDQVAAGANQELLPALAELRARGTRCVLGLRDILDEPKAVRRQWGERGELDTLRQFFDEIWIYGERRVFDVVEAYGLPAELAARTHYLGYLDPRAANEEWRLPSELPQEGFDLCLVGGGQDGTALANAFAAAPGPAELPRVVVTGPFMPKPDADALPRCHGGGGPLSVFRMVDGVAHPGEAGATHRLDGRLQHRERAARPGPAPAGRAAGRATARAVAARACTGPAGASRGPPPGAPHPRTAGRLAPRPRGGGQGAATARLRWTRARRGTGSRRAHGTSRWTLTRDPAGPPTCARTRVCPSSATRAARSTCDRSSMPSVGAARPSPCSP